MRFKQWIWPKHIVHVPVQTQDTRGIMKIPLKKQPAAEYDSKKSGLDNLGKFLIIARMSSVIVVITWPKIRFKLHYARSYLANVDTSSAWQSIQKLWKTWKSLQIQSEPVSRRKKKACSVNIFFSLVWFPLTFLCLPPLSPPFSTPPA